MVCQTLPEQSSFTEQSSFNMFDSSGLSFLLLLIRKEFNLLNGALLDKLGFGDWVGYDIEYLRICVGSE